MVLSGPAAPAVPPPADQPPAEHPLSAEVRQLLTDGRVAEALARTDRQLQANAADATIRSIYVELRMAIVRQSLAAQKFQQAETLLGQVLAADGKHASAGKMLETIRSARKRVDESQADAEQLLRLERFEQAAALLAQIAGLLPDQPQRWKQSWLAAAIGAGDDHYLMRNYEAALPFYSQAIELSRRPAAAASQPDDGQGFGERGAGVGNAAADTRNLGPPELGEELMWRWSHSYAMSLAATATVRRSGGQWQSIITTAADNFQMARASSLAMFVTALGRENLGEFANAIQAYRDLLGPAAPPMLPNVPPARLAESLRRQATEYVDSLYRGAQIGRRAGAWAAVLPGDFVERKSPGVAVRAYNDLAARFVIEAINYHAPRLAEYLGGSPEDLKWEVDYQVSVRSKMPAKAPADRLADPLIPSYSRIISDKGRLVRHFTECCQTDPLLLGATVPHELSHILISRLAGYPPVPLAIDEGLAIHAETTARYLMFRRELIRHGGPRFGVNELLSIQTMPATGRAQLYAEFYNLVAWLLTRGPAARVIDLCRLTATVSPQQALLKTYALADLPTAEKAYRTFLEDQGLIRQQERN